MIRKIELMHKLFGKLPGRTCKECDHLCSFTASHKWYKCENYGETSSEATDWRLKWSACGLIDIPKRLEVPVVKMLRFYNQEPKSSPQITGQMTIDEWLKESKNHGADREEV